MAKSTMGEWDIDAYRTFHLFGDGTARVNEVTQGWAMTVEIGPFWSIVSRLDELVGARNVFTVDRGVGKGLGAAGSDLHLPEMSGEGDLNKIPLSGGYAT